MTIDVLAQSTSYGLAYVCPQQSNGAFANNQEFVIQATTADATSLTAPCPTSTPAPSGVANVSGAFDISAIPGAAFFEAFIGGAINGPQTGTTGTYSGVAPAGTYDVVSLAYSDAGRTVIGGSILRGQTITNNMTLNIPAFTAANAGTPETITLPPSQTSYIEDAWVTYVTAGGTRAPLANPTTFNSYTALPAAVQQDGDYYDALCQYWRVTTGGSEYMTDEQTFVTPTVPAFTVPTGVSVPIIPNSPYTTFPFYNTALVSGHVYDYAQLTWGASYAETVYVSPAWLAANTSYTLPNFSAVSPAFFAPGAAASVNWTSSSNSSTLPFAATVQNSSRPLPVNATLESLLFNGNYTAT